MAGRLPGAAFAGTETIPRWYLPGRLDWVCMGTPRPADRGLTFEKRARTGLFAMFVISFVIDRVHPGERRKVRRTAWPRAPVAEGR